MSLKVLDALYDLARSQKSDINEHCEWLKDLASQCECIVEFGVRGGVSTVSLLAGQPRFLYSYDINDCDVERFEKNSGSTIFKFTQGDSRQVTIPVCDLLFIDTDHSYSVLKKELDKHHSRVKKWILMHDTVLFGEKGMTEPKGIMQAIKEFLKENDAWKIKEERLNNNGMMLLERK